MKIPPQKPRNPLVATVKFRKAGAHQKTSKALRRQAKVILEKITEAAEDKASLLTPMP